MALLELTIPGDPVPKGRPRHGANGNSYTPSRTRAAEKVVAQYVALSMRGQKPSDARVGVAVEFFCATARRTDGDNLLKLVTDAMNEIVYDDDAQIEEYFCRVHRGVGAQAARTELFVWELGDQK